MTLNQLLSEVYALGFEDEGELDESFVFSVRRALKMIFTELAPAVRGKIVISEDSAKELDLRKHFDDVMIITSAPTDKSGRIIRGAFSDGYRVTLPDTFTGEAYIRYKPKPQAIDVDHADDEITIPAFAEHLLPLLTASFVFLDDDAEKADYYMTLYRHEALKLTRATADSINNTYTDVTGWA